MPLVHPTHVVSFSSEDPHHPASNLLNRETYRKWKCKDPGEKEAFVILKFDKAVSFTAVDIGNDGSALVEVSVARSGSGGEPEFEVLLSSTAFMSPGDSREGKNLNGVRNFSINSLCKPVASQKWDLVKVLVCQPFNKHVQYGLTFVKFVAPPDPDEPKKIGAFAFRTPIGGKDSSDSDEDIRPGRLFQAKKVNPASASIASTNIEIRDTAKKLADASKARTNEFVEELLRVSKPDSVSPKTNGSQARSNKGYNPPQISRKQLDGDSTPLKSKDKDTGSSKFRSDGSSSSATPKTCTPSSTSHVTKNNSGKKRQLSPEPGPSSLKQTQKPSTPKKQKKVRKTAPFNKLFEGVIFAMSGFQNPLRAQIRDKALEMGAKYKADWDRSCTHLICAFYNTPKFREVRAARCGVIVKKDWIEQSYSKKIRFPWRRYCLDRDDKGPESEDEIFCQSDENESDEVMEQEEDSVAEEDVKPKRKRIMVMESSDDSEKSNDGSGAYNEDTDVDQNEDDDKTPDLSPSMLSSNYDETTDPDTNVADFFNDLGFYIYSDANSSVISTIIKKHKGMVINTPTDDVDFYICHNFEWVDDFTDALSDNPNLIFIHQQWVLECDKENKLIDKDRFLLSPL